MYQLRILLVLVSVAAPCLALENGLAQTPPMGWLTWERFRCITDCKAYPNECISEALVLRHADLMVSEGYLDAGYNYLGIDDCWLEWHRGPNGQLLPNAERFPRGMKYISDYLHNKGLKFGIYEDYGTKTCAGYPGVLGNERLDVDTLASWDIDYLKLDGCKVDIYAMDAGYPAFGALLNATGRPILYSCSWPAYQEYEDVKPNYTSIAQHCNLWRNWIDIDDSWSSVTKIMDWFGDNQDRLAPHAGPGHWNDPDMLIIGNFGLSVDQARVQMAVWAVMAAPLLISADLATMRPEFKEILLNRDVIAVNQDPLGIQGLRVFKVTGNITRHGLEIWTRPIKVPEGFHHAYAVAFVSQRDDGTPYAACFTFDEMKLPRGNYAVKDLYHEEADRDLKDGESFRVRVNPTGVKFFRFLGRSEEKTPKNCV